MKTEAAAKEVLSVRELANFMGIGMKTAYKLVENRTIPSFRLGGKLVRIRRTDVEQFMERQVKL